MKRVIDLTNQRTGYLKGGIITWHNGVREAHYLAYHRYLLDHRENVNEASAVSNPAQLSDCDSEARS